MYPGGPNAQTRMGGEQLTFVNYTDESDHSLDSSCSFPYASLPCTVMDIFPHSRGDATLPEEDNWNLIPYDVRWGSEYYGYRAGTLPGPGGTCIFLCSPTPLEKRRVDKACNKCRKRKAKVRRTIVSRLRIYVNPEPTAPQCSGCRPACTRCTVRGYVCEYAKEDKHTAPRRRRPHRQREHSKGSAEATDSPSSHRDPWTDYVQPEEELVLWTPEFSFTDADPHLPSGYHPHGNDVHYPLEVTYEYDSASVDACHEPAKSGEHYIHSLYAEGCSYPPVGLGSSQTYHQATDPHPAVTSAHAQGPVGSTVSPTLFTPEGQTCAFAAMSGSNANTHTGGHVPGVQRFDDPMPIHLTPADVAAPGRTLLQAPLNLSPIDSVLEAGALGYVFS